MWKRERPERIDLEHVMTEPPPVAAVYRANPPPPAPVVEATPDRPLPAVAQPVPAVKGSTIGATLRFKGDLIADEDLVVQGQVEGSILHSRSLTIGAQGRMHGDIRARRIILEGEVHGNLYALESVSLRAGATVHGDVFAPRIAIDDGARLCGRIDMDKAPTVPTVNIAAATASDPVARDLSDPDVGALLSSS